MALIDFLIFIGVGCIVGFLAGFFGVGGGILIVPILIFSYEQSGVSPAVLTQIALATSLFVIVFASLTSTYQQSKQGNVDWRSVFVLGFSSAMTALAATTLATWLNGRYLQIFFSLIVMAIAIGMLTEGKKQASKKLELAAKSGIHWLLGIGFAAGIVAALAGVGGGVITIPMMYYLLNMPLKLAIGTSSATIVITALFSLVGYILNGLGREGLPGWSIGFVDLQHGVALAIGTILMARVGAYVSFKTHPFRLRKIFALFAIMVSIYMLVK